VDDIDKLSKERVRAHIKKMWANKGGCTVCNSNSWEILEETFLIANKSVDRPFPVSIVVCARCGNTMLFSNELVAEQTPDPMKILD
jgi:hypothetical protein